MRILPCIGKSEGLEIGPVIRGFQLFRQLGSKPEAAVIMWFSQNHDQIVAGLSQADQALPDKLCPNALLLKCRTNR